MNDYQAIIDQIQTVINISESTPVESLRGLAQDYAQACQEINARLAGVHRFLQAGNNSEAIRLADTTTPHLLDLCNQLDFPELDEWTEICRSYQLTMPPPIKTSTIDALNEVYETVAQMEPLLKKMRLLSLAHGPLQERLAILYQLEAIEPQNIIWNEAIPDYELARVHELQREFEEIQLLEKKSATSFDPSETQSNLDHKNQIKNARIRLKKIQEELQVTPWKNPPDTLIQEIKRWMEHQNAEISLHKLCENSQFLEKALLDNDRSAIQKELQRWDSLIQSGQLSSRTLPVSLLKIYEQAVAFLKKEEEKERQSRLFDEKCQAFTLRLYDSPDQEHLKILFKDLLQTATKMKREIPKPLLLNYQNLQAKWAKRKMLRILTIGGLFFFVLLLTVLVAMALILPKAHSSKSSKEIQEFVQLMNDYNAAPNDEALFQRLTQKGAELQSSPFRQNSQYAPLLAKYELLIQKEEERAADFQKWLTEARNSLNQDAASQQTLNRDAFNRAKASCVTDQEQKQFAAVEADFLAMESEQNQESFRQFQAKLSPFKTSFDELKDNATDALSTRLQKIADLEKQLEAMTEDANPLIRKERTSFLNEIQSYRTELFAQNEIESALAGLQDHFSTNETFSLTRAVSGAALKSSPNEPPCYALNGGHIPLLESTLDDYLYEMETFGQKFPHSLFSKDISDVLRQADAFFAIWQWNDLVNQWSRQNVTGQKKGQPTKKLRWDLSFSSEERLKNASPPSNEQSSLSQESPDGANSSEKSEIDRAASSSNASNVSAKNTSNASDESAKNIPPTVSSNGFESASSSWAFSLLSPSMNRQALFLFPLFSNGNEFRVLQEKMTRAQTYLSPQDRQKTDAALSALLKRFQQPLWELLVPQKKSQKDAFQYYYFKKKPTSSQNLFYVLNPQGAESEFFENLSDAEIQESFLAPVSVWAEDFQQQLARLSSPPVEEFQDNFYPWFDSTLAAAEDLVSGQQDERWDPYLKASLLYEYLTILTQHPFFEDWKPQLESFQNAGFDPSLNWCQSQNKLLTQREIAQELLDNIPWSAIFEKKRLFLERFLQDSLPVFLPLGFLQKKDQQWIVTLAQKNPIQKLELSESASSLWVARLANNSSVIEVQQPLSRAASAESKATSTGVISETDAFAESEADSSSNRSFSLKIDLIPAGTYQGETTVLPSKDEWRQGLPVYFLLHVSP